MAPAMHRPAPMRHHQMRMMSHKPAPSHMMHKKPVMHMKMKHQPMKHMKHKPVVHHMKPKYAAPVYKKDDHKYEWYKPTQKHATYVSHEEKSYGDDKHYEKEVYKHETKKYV